MGRRNLTVAAAAVLSLSICSSAAGRSPSGGPSREASSSSAAIAASGNESCALTSSGGGLKCWGANNDGQVGDGTTKRRLTPAAVSGLSTGVEAMAVGGRNDAHTCALRTGGALKCWGEH